MGAQVKIVGVDAFLKDLNKYFKQVEKHTTEEMVQWSVRTKSAAKRDVRYKTGDLEGTIRSEVTNNGLTVEVKAGGINGVDYAPYIEFGTGVGVDKTFLQEYGLTDYAWDFKGNGDPIFPIPAKSFLFRNGREEFEQSVKNIIKLLQQT
jgi:hypothetical protein